MHFHPLFLWSRIVYRLIGYALLIMDSYVQTELRKGWMETKMRDKYKYKSDSWTVLYSGIQNHAVHVRSPMCECPQRRHQRGLNHLIQIRQKNEDFPPQSPSRVRVCWPLSAWDQQRFDHFMVFLWRRSPSSIRACLHVSSVWPVRSIAQRLEKERLRLSTLNEWFHFFLFLLSY